MTPFYHCQISQFPLEEGQHQSHIPLFSLGTSTTSTSSCPPFPFDNKQDHRPHDGDLPLHQAQLQDQYVQEGDQQLGPVKWMSSKMRIMRKMMNSDQTPKTKPRRINHQHQEQKRATQDSIIRVCSDCNTTKTPLWRSGPRGPKSLCNACGIRQRKARRAMATSTVSSGMPNDGKNKVSNVVDRTMPFKKRCRFAQANVSSENTQRKLCFEDIVISLKKSSAFQRVFPQDEKDAAILLMALSSGLLCSS